MLCRSKFKVILLITVNEQIHRSDYLDDVYTMTINNYVIIIFLCM